MASCPRQEIPIQELPVRMHQQFQYQTVLDMSLHALKQLISSERTVRGPHASALRVGTQAQRASACSSLTRASTQRAPSAVCSFFQNGASDLR